MNPVFSVIIPLYNKERTLRRAVGSVLKQTFSGFELLVVNDGSTDGSAEVLERFTDVRMVVLAQQNQGPAAARNLGIANAKGAYIAFLDADDYWENNHLEALLKLCRAFPGAGMYGMRYRKVYSEKSERAAVFKGIPDHFFGLVPDYFEACGMDSVASASSVALAAGVFETVGRFNPAMRSGEDTEFWIRVALRYPVALNTTITANYTMNSSGSLSKSDPVADTMKWLSAFRAQEKNNPSLKKYMDLNRYALALRYALQGDQKHRKEALKDIHYGNLNHRQRLLLRLPGPLLRMLKRLRLRLAGNGVFLSVFGR